MKAYVNFSKRDGTAAVIKEVVCDYFNLPAGEFSFRKCTREIAQARKAATYLCKMHTKMPMKSIGAAIGGKNHATVVHACKTVSNLIDIDKGFRLQIEEIEKRLK